MRVFMDLSAAPRTKQAKMSAQCRAPSYTQHRSTLTLRPAVLLNLLTFYSEHWRVSYSCPGESSYQFWFLCAFLFSIGIDRPMGQTDRRTGKYRNAAAPLAVIPAGTPVDVPAGITASGAAA